MNSLKIENIPLENLLKIFEILISNFKSIEGYKIKKQEIKDKLVLEENASSDNENEKNNESFDNQENDNFLLSAEVFLKKILIFLIFFRCNIKNSSPKCIICLKILMNLSTSKNSLQISKKEIKNFYSILFFL